LLVLASVTDSLATFAQHLVRDGGLPAIFLLMLLESACIPIPSEATMLFAGFAVADVGAGVAGNLVGSWIAYGVGYFGRLELVERHGHWLHIKPSQLAWADRWFERYGDASVFFSRLLPVIRTFISLPAGVGRMPFWRFTVLTLVGCVPWVFALGLIGREVGHNWTQWKDALHYVVDVVAVAIVLLILWAIMRWWRRRGQGEPAADIAA
jgi:membrane protein DedA with SNARE-associated domain